MGILYHGLNKKKYAIYRKKYSAVFFSKSRFTFFTCAYFILQTPTPIISKLKLRYKRIELVCLWSIHMAAKADVPYDGMHNPKAWNVFVHRKQLPHFLVNLNICRLAYSLLLKYTKSGSILGNFVEIYMEIGLSLFCAESWTMCL